MKIICKDYGAVRLRWVKEQLGNLSEHAPDKACVNAWKLRDLRVIFENRITNMDHKHFKSTKRHLHFSVIFKSKPTNQVIRYEHEGQVSAKIMLAQKADFLKFNSN